MKKSTQELRQFSGWKVVIAAVCLFSAVASKAQTVLIPFSGSTSVPCGSNVALQDHAGNASYAINANGFVVLDAGAYASINVAGTYTTESGFDFIRIYNGVGTAGALLATYSGQNLSFNFQGTPGQTLTVRFQSDGSVNYAGFDLNVTYSGACNTVACSGAPGSNTVVGPSVLICPNAGPNTLTLSNTYITGSTPATAIMQTGLTYAWFSSTTSPVGPFTTAVTGATTSTVAAPGSSVSIWYQAVITCTNGGPFTTSATPGAILIASTTTSVVPYRESFEGIGYNNLLPNCSWLTSGLGTTFQTYTASASNNRVPRTGTSFGAFVAPANNVYVYTNGIQMEPGITYSAAIHYASDYSGSTNWSNMRILVGPNQSTTGLVQVASTSPAVSGPYKRLDNTFTVPSSGIYYLAINATGISGTAPYLMLDDISVTIPCDMINGNSPTITTIQSATTACQNDVVTISANGADTYTWSTGDTGPVITPTALAIGLNTLGVSGTNTLTGCINTNMLYINIIPSPPISVFANNPVSCSGQPVNISAYGTGSFQWNNNATTSYITVSPTVNTTYFVTLTNVQGCSTTASIQIVVNPLPTVTIVGGVAEICAGEALNLFGNGGVQYQWTWNVNISQTMALTDHPMSTTVYTLTGTNTNGCSNKATYTQNVNPCTGITLNEKAESRVYPNPTSGLITIESGEEPVSQIYISNIAGQKLMTFGGFENSTQLNIESLPAGVYFISAVSTSSTRTVMIVKE
jgi:hypothetical protein